MSAFRNSVQIILFGILMDEVIEEWIKYIMRSLMIISPHPVWLG
jgi:hypothetical protein